MSKQKLSSFNKAISQSVTADDVLGKEVIDPDGAFIGVVDSLYLDPHTFMITGVSIDKGFLKKGLVIGTDYLDRVTDHAVFLTESPLILLRGMQVFDVNGLLVGTVREIVQEGSKNRLEKLVLSGRGSIEIERSDIAKIGGSVLLKSTKEELLKRTEQ